ncbi:MAG: hypothetical protein WAT09_13630 [Paracoccaceae bacterium]
MISINDTRQPVPNLSILDNNAGPRIPPRKWAILPADDYRQLQRHLELCENTRPPGWAMLAHVLHHKIMTAEPVPIRRVTDMVTGGCRVTYAVDDGPPQIGLLTQRARSGLHNGVIPVSSLMGATLIGMRIGQRAPLPSVDGTVYTVTVLDVAHPT